MTKLAKTLLVLSIVCTVVGGVINLDWVKLGEITGFYAVLPLGAVFFGLFLIVLVLEKEGDENPEDKHLSDRASADPAKVLPPEPETAGAGKH